MVINPGDVSIIEEMGLLPGRVDSSAMSRYRPSLAAMPTAHFAALKTAGARWRDLSRQAFSHRCGFSLATDPEHWSAQGPTMKFSLTWRRPRVYT